MDHISHLSKQTELKTKDGTPIEILELPGIEDFEPETLQAWAKHFREHYCLDNEIDDLRYGTGLTRREYLQEMKFPTTTGFGPAIRAGDFGEILVADYLQFKLKYWVPRTRYNSKSIRNESPKGCDVLAFRTIDDSSSPKDVLAIFETKTQFSGRKAKPRLQDAVDDSGKDPIRKAESLNAIKQQLARLQRTEEVHRIARFQDKLDHPYTEIFGAAALFLLRVYDPDLISETDTSNHPDKNNLKLIVIKGPEMMKLVHKLYEIAAYEA